MGVMSSQKTLPAPVQESYHDWLGHASTFITTYQKSKQSLLAAIRFDHTMFDFVGAYESSEIIGLAGMFPIYVNASN